MKRKKHVMVSLSGGLDSSTLLFWLLNNGYYVSTVSFNYGQINIVELHCRDLILEEAKKRYSNQLVNTEIIDVSYLLNTIQFQTKELNEKLDKNVCEFYFPSRNMLFASILTVKEEIFKLENQNEYDSFFIALGLQKHSVYEDYWDSNVNFFLNFGHLISENPNDIRIIAPFIKYLKKDVIEVAKELNVPFNKTWTCYNPVEVERNIFKPCNKCESCRERLEGGKKAGVDDINKYEIIVPEL